ncbi:MAG: uracil-DNA glycosylase [Thermodesulfobacteriota bacterium]
MGQTKEEMISDLIGYLRYIRERGISYLPTSHKRKLLSLKEIREELGNCQRCKLHRLRRNIVFGEGNEEAKLMLIGEGPGYDEDVQGRPFVGKAGQLLTRILQTVQVDRKEVYITNIIKCRPPGNRNPEPDEIKSCYPFLLKQIQAIRPKVICALGTFAAQTLLQKEAKITSLRGKSFDFQGIKIFPTYHPAFLLRNPEKKKEVWEDIQKIMHALREEGR